MSQCFLLLGTNLNDKRSNLEVAAREISSHVGEILTKSSIYLTAAWGKTDQDDFLNQVLRVETNLFPTSLLQTCLDIESSMGRVRYERWGERLIDIDVLYMDDMVLDETSLKIPHPEIQNRRFTLAPLAEIAPDFIHPVLKSTQAKLLQSCPDMLEAVKII